MKALLSRWTAEFLLKEHTHQHVCMCVWGNGAGDSVLVKRARHRIRIPTPNPRSTKDLPPKQSISQIAVWEQQEMSLPIGNVLTVAKPVGTFGSNSLTTSRATIGYGLLQLRSLIPVPIHDDRHFNNADGFAMVFDPAWKECLKRGELEEKSVDEKIETVIRCLHDHPFVQSEPEQARQVARFRVRLLEL